VSAISTHVLDIAAGRPAAGMRVRLERVTPAGPRVAPVAEQIGAASTDADGRIASLGPEVIPPGTYRLVFDTGGYLVRPRGAGGSSTDASDGADTTDGTEIAPPFFPEVTVTFAVTDGEHYHVPLLMSPFGYSTYRGS
jgi:5-hydroxyisourate hydrolase